jgi:hypothetical protein
MGGKASALGRTQGGGPVDAAAAIAKFMGSSSAGAATGASASTTKAAKKPAAAARGLLDALTGGAGSAKAAGGASAQGTKTPKGTSESGVAASAGSGASSGLPTTSSTGEITMTFHQVNQDGAGPLTASIDPSSGGTDPAAFVSAPVTQDVPGIGIGGLSGASTMDFQVKVQMPAGMTCSGSVGGASNVCVVRMMNSALAGPFGGSAAFTQDTAARKRAVEYNLRKRHFARGVLGRLEAEE